MVCTQFCTGFLYLCVAFAVNPVVSGTLSVILANAGLVSFFGSKEPELSGMPQPAQSSIA